MKDFSKAKQLLREFQLWLDEYLLDAETTKRLAEWKKLKKFVELFAEPGFSIPEEARRKIELLEAENQKILELADDLISLGRKIKSLTTGYSKNPNTLLEVRLPDGKVICDSKAVDTFIATLLYIGLDKCAQVNDIRLNGHPVVSQQRNPNGRNLKKVAGYYIEVNTSTATKADLLMKYAKRLNLDIDVAIVEG